MRRAFIFLVVVAVCLAQTATPPAISAYYRLPTNPSGPFPYQWLLVDPPLSLTFDGTSPHLSIVPPAGIPIQSSGSTIGTANTIDVEPGIGIICTTQVSAGVMTLQCNADTAIIAYRVDPPAASGRCVDPATGKLYGAGAWATDSAYFYFCIPTSASQLIWARAPLQTTW